METEPTSQNENYEEFLKLDPEAFDQDEEKGWRKIEKSGKPLEAAKVIELYLESNQDIICNGSAEDVELGKFMHFHIGQLLALTDEKYYDKAVLHFQQAFLPEQEGWNFYVEGTIAFLQKDKAKLDKNIQGLVTLERKLGVGINNLNLLLNFAEALDDGDTSYKKAYEKDELSASSSTPH